MTRKRAEAAALHLCRSSRPARSPNLTEIFDCVFSSNLWHHKRKKKTHPGRTQDEQGVHRAANLSLSLLSAAEEN